jgi:ABC-type branched-subunit amino acid transport system substrate-binding protein
MRRAELPGADRFRPVAMGTNESAESPQRCRSISLRELQLSKEIRMNRKRVLGASLGLVVVVSLTLAGCSGASSNTGSSSAPKLTGSPVKIGVITPIGTSSQNYPDNVAAMKAAAGAVDAAGGISGHPIDIISCNEGYDPNQATACARTMKSDGVMATVRDYSVDSAYTLTQLLNQEGISQVFAGGLAAQQFNSPNFYPVDGDAPFAAAGVVQDLAKVKHVKSIAIANLAVAATQFGSQTINNAAKNNGVKNVGEVDIPVDVSDYSSYAAKLVAEHPQAIVMYMPGTMMAELVPAIAAAGGSKIILASPASSFTGDTLSQMGAAGDNMVVGGPTPPLSASSKYPGVAKYIKEMKTEQNSGDSDADIAKVSNTSMMGWLAIHGIAQATKSMKSFTSTAFNAQLKKTSPINIEGLVTWSPGKTGPIAGFPSVTNFEEYFYTTKNGQFTPDGLTKSDVEGALKGLK